MMVRGLVYSLIGGGCGLSFACLSVLMLLLFFENATGLIVDVLLFGGVLGAATFPMIGLLWDDGDWFWKR